VSIIRAAIARARTLPAAYGRYRRDLTGWLLSRSLEPNSRFKIKTPPRFEPVNVPPRARAIADFAQRQDELSLLLREASGLDLRRVKVASPFNPKLKYNLYSCFSVLAAHERRHLTQAEAAVGG
jgi:DinB superfamily